MYGRIHAHTIPVMEYQMEKETEKTWELRVYCGL